MSTRRSRGLRGAGVALALLAAGPAGAAVDAGVCAASVWTGVPLAELARSERGLAAYCEHLLAGAADLRRHHPAAALAAFVSAEQAAAALSRQARRRAARDEARGGQALAMEAAGRVPEAIALLAATRGAPPDGLGLARAYLYARHGLRQEAATALAGARRALPPQLWCRSDDEALAALHAGAPVTARSLDVLYLPSFLRPCDVGAVRGLTPAEQVASPRSAHVHFPLGDDRPYAHGEAGRLNRAVLASIAELLADADAAAGAHWTLTGHTDQSCPRGCAGRCCAEYNASLGERRAAGVRERLLALLGDGPDIGVESRGLSQPIVAPPPGSRGVVEANRRVELKLLGREAAPVAALDCPWTLRVFDPAPVAGTPRPARAARPDAEPLVVPSAARYELVFSGDPSRWRHLYAFSEASDRRFSDLLGLGGLQSSAAGELVEKGRRLPARRTRDRELTYYLFEGGAGLEVIHAFAAAQSVAPLERFRARINATLGAAPGPVTRVRIEETPWRSLPALAPTARVTLGGSGTVVDAGAGPAPPAHLGAVRGVSDFAGGWDRLPRIDPRAAGADARARREVQREVAALDERVIQLLAAPPASKAGIVRCEFRLARR